MKRKLNDEFSLLENVGLILNFFKKNTFWTLG